MKFTDYVEEQEIWNAVSLDESFFDAIKHGSKMAGSLANSAISGIGRGGIQAIRGAGNTLGGLARTGYGAIGSVVGPEDSRKYAREQLKKGAIQTGKGLLQGIASPIAAGARSWDVMRGEHGGLKPGGEFGQMIGTRRASNKDNEVNPSPMNSDRVQRSTPYKMHDYDDYEARSDGPKEEPIENSWERLKQHYIALQKRGRKSEASKVAKIMKANFPKEYQIALEKSRNQNSSWEELKAAHTTAKENGDNTVTRRIEKSMKDRFPKEFQAAVEKSQKRPERNGMPHEDDLDDESFYRRMGERL